MHYEYAPITVVFCMLSVRSTISRLECRPVPSFNMRVAAAPALLAGTMWSTGNLLSIIAVDALGLSIGFPLIQCQIIISNLWAILYYKELQTRTAAMIFFASTFVLLGGVWMLAWYGT